MNRSRTVSILSLWATAGVIVASPVAVADVVRLKSGGEVRGKIEDPSVRNGEPLTIRTRAGLKFTFSGDDYEFFTFRSMKYEEYEDRAKAAPRTPEAQWELAEWARERQMLKQQRTHLLILVELEPNHEDARRILGHVQHEGGWMPRDELMQKRGLVKYRGRWITPQEREILDKTDAEREVEKQWYVKIRRWLTWLGGTNPQRQQEALTELTEIRDPAAISSLIRLMQKAENPLLRKLYLRVLGQIPGPRPVTPLVWQILYDNDPELRYAALKEIDTEHADVAVPELIRGLKSDYNAVILRSASALQHLGNDDAIPHLIEALVTKHKYRILVNDRSNSYSFASNGSFAGGQSSVPAEIETLLRTGQLRGAIVNNPNQPPAKKRAVVFEHTHTNEPVLVALAKLTGQNYGYDERSWRLWYTADKKKL